MINIKQFKTLCLMALASATLWSCGDDDNPQIIPPTASAIINAEVGGPTQPNQVFIDLSAENQTAIARNSWDLAFYNGTEFRVILNNATSALAIALNKTDIAAVSAADTLGLGTQLDIDAIFGALQGPPPAWLGDAASWLDDPSGDLSNTAIEEISQAATSNPVYVLNRGKNPDGSQRGWVKIRVLRNTNDYTLQYAAIASSTFTELNISKNSDFTFSYASVDNGAVSVEPAAESWDLAFTTFTNLLPIGPTTSIPYLFKDFVIQNRNGVELAAVAVETNLSYDSFSFSDIAEQTFTTDIASIGSGWRTVAQPRSPTPTGVKEDIFYVLKDAAGNHYKLRFTRMLNPETGERGFPQLQYDLLTQE
ncbi:MAG: hypothetical protein HEP71_14800 [Roseivirga sp.]|nr:hypothetical protein [Roseivirga sp.]